MRAASNMLWAFQMLVASAPSMSIRSDCSISRIDCEIDRLPAESSTMNRSPGRSYTIILRNVLIWSNPAFVRESDTNTIPAATLSAAQYVTMTIRAKCC